MWSPMKICSIFGFSWSIMVKFCVLLRTSSRKTQILLLHSTNIDFFLVQSNLHVRPPPINGRQSKHQNFPSQSLTVRTSSKRPPPVSDRNHFLGLTVNDFPWFLTYCKRPLDAFSDLYFRCVHYVTLNILKTLVAT